MQNEKVLKSLQLLRAKNFGGLIFKGIFLMMNKKFFNLFKLVRLKSRYFHEFSERFSNLFVKIAYHLKSARFHDNLNPPPSLFDLVKKKTILLVRIISNMQKVFREKYHFVSIMNRMLRL